MGGMTTDVSGRVIGKAFRGNVGDARDEGTMMGDEGREGSDGMAMRG